MAPNLPVETWSQIASYLTTTEAINLCSVNRVLYTVAQNIRYKEVAVTRITHGTVAKLRHLRRSPEAAERVTSLLLDFAGIATLECTHPLWKKVLDSTRELIRYVTCRSDPKEFYMTADNSACDVFDVLLDSVKRMDNLRHLRLSGSAPLGFEPYGSKLWELVSERITSLAIRGLWPTHIAELSETHYRGLSRLTSLSLSLYAFPAWSPAECTQVARFINSAKRTLQWLTVDGDATVVQLVFPNVDHLERLKRINLPADVNVLSIQAIVDFINLHGLHLEELSVPLFFEPSFLSRLRLPHLRKLQLRLCQLVPDDCRWAGVLHFRALENLTLEAADCELIVICDAFQRSGSGHRLRHLLLTVCWWPRERIDLLATTFPELQTLTICLRWSNGNFPMVRMFLLYRWHIIRDSPRCILRLSGNYTTSQSSGCGLTITPLPVTHSIWS